MKPTRQNWVRHRDSIVRTRIYDRLAANEPGGIEARIPVAAAHPEHYIGLVGQNVIARVSGHVVISDPHVDRHVGGKIQQRVKFDSSAFVLQRDKGLEFHTELNIAGIVGQAGMIELHVQATADTPGARPFRSAPTWKRYLRARLASRWHRPRKLRYTNGIGVRLDGNGHKQRAA